MIEYKMICLEKTTEKVEEQINSLAEEGWRIVCSCGKNNRHLVLKRKKEVEEE